LAILPISCSLLNYLYPKIMDVFFPKLSEKKQDKTQDTFCKAIDEAFQPRFMARKGGA